MTARAVSFEKTTKQSIQASSSLFLKTVSLAVLEPLYLLHELISEFGHKVKSPIVKNAEVPMSPPTGY